MADTFRLDGSFTSSPLSGCPSGAQNVSASILESVQLRNKAVDLYDLQSDAPVTVSLGSMAKANVIIAKATGGKVVLGLTSANGTAQSVPGEFIAIISQTTPYTAITITRAPGVRTQVQLFLGERV